MQSNFRNTHEADSDKKLMVWFLRDRDSQQNATRWTSTQRAKAQTCLDLIDMVYASNTKLFLNYGKSMITIKIDHPLVRDKKLLKEVESILEEKKIVKLVTPQGVTYRMMRKNETD